MFGLAIVGSLAKKVLKANAGGLKRAVGLAPKKVAPVAMVTAEQRVRDVVATEAGKLVNAVAGGAVDAASYRATGNFWSNPQTRKTMLVGGGVAAVLLVLLGVIAFRRK